LGEDTVEARVIRIVASALGVDEHDVRRHSSLIDDLGAESIDFLDLVFRLETEFGIKIAEDDIWRGAIDEAAAGDAAALARAIAPLRQRMPEFRWDRLPSTLGREDLPRLITVNTILDYLQRRGIGGAA
jgi:acyl carrier protein